MKIAMLFPYAPLYREPIYLMMDKEYDIDWFFCSNSGHSIKEMDYSRLSNVNLSMKEIMLNRHSFWYKHLLSLNLDNYDYLVIPGQTHCLAEWYLAMRYGKRDKNPKVFFWTHGWYGKESRLQKLLKRIYYHYADGMFVYGDRAKKMMIEEGYNQDNIYPIHNSLNYDEHLKLRGSLSNSSVYSDHFRNNLPVLIFVGRLTKVKRLDLLIDALGLLAHNGDYYNLVLVGDGGELDYLKAKACSLHLQERLWFYGSCYDERKNAELIYNADLCVAPGNIGLTAIHSLAFGTPCLTHNCFEMQMPEVESIKDGSTGCFFLYDDVESLADSIKRWFLVTRNRTLTREACYNEIDTRWNPYYQIEVIKTVLK